MYENHPVEVPQEGSYLRGLIGALLGALVGAVAWCLVMQLGVIASLVGFAIGFVAEKGYTLFKGKVGGGKVVILIIAVIFGVLAGTFGAHYVDWCQAIGEYAPVSYGEVPGLILDELRTNEEYMIATVKDLALGLLFAFLGVFGVLKSASQQAKARAEQNKTM